MQVVSGTFQLKTWYVTMKDGTIQEVQAGSFRLTSDGMWTFYRESAVPKMGGHILHAIYSNGVKGIYSAENVILEATLEKFAKGMQNTEVRKKSPKKKPVQQQIKDVK